MLNEEKSSSAGSEENSAKQNEQNLNQSTTPEIPDDQSAQAEKPKKKYPILKIATVGLIGLLFVMVIALASYVILGQSKTQDNQLTETEVSTLETNATETDPTADWKTYSNEEFGFSIKHPTETTPEITENGINLNFTPNIKTLEEMPYWIYINHYPNTNSLDFKDLATTDLPSDLIESFTYTTEEINGNTAHRTTTLPSAHGCDHVFFENPNGEFVSVNFCVYDEKNPFNKQEEYHKIFNQILSTFKFTDTKTTLDTSDWKTYENSSFTFKYPNSLTLNEYKLENKEGTISIFFADKDDPMYNECMERGEPEINKAIYVSTFTEVVRTNEFCSSGDGTRREIWITGKDLFAPGLQIMYSTKDEEEAFEIKDNILRTFQFTN